LVESGLIVEQRRGNLRLLRAETDGALARPLTELLTLTYGPIAVLGELLGAVNGVDEAYVFGSWAARYEGEPGPPPRDVDVLVVGGADEDEVFSAARAAQSRLGREVNVHQVPARAWHGATDDPFLLSLRARPLVPIDLEGDQR
jgi:predicted nucleotidyltransferase